MSTLTTIQSTDLITDSRADINNNFSALNTDKMETSVLDTDSTLSANSDAKIPSQKAVKAYVDAGGNVNASTTAKGIVEEATLDEVKAGTQVGATGARLYVNPSSLNSQLKLIEKKTLGADSATVTFTNLGSYHTVIILAAPTVLRDDASGNTIHAYVSTDNGSTWLSTNSYLALISSVTDDYIYLGANGIGTTYIPLEINFFNTTLPFKPVKSLNNLYRYSVVSASALNALKIEVSFSTGNHRFQSGSIFFAYGLSGTLDEA